MTEMLPFGRLLGLAEWDALPEDDQHRRLEVSEGVLMMTPRPMPVHQRVVNRLAVLLDEHLPRDWSAFGEVDVLVTDEPLTIRVPDVAVTSTESASANPARFRAYDVLLVVEVLSEGTRRVDRVTKFSEYAEVGIPHYWIVEPWGKTALSAYRLGPGGYELVSEYTGDSAIRIDGIATIPVDLDALAERK
ncbi:Uma2 family endonuclease [Sciscionella marina]|uniref:Uma2 family endonuclease n=1 Tax=Sciscionella marina TaxID=508770 RepID=UPI0003710672|nr:Uma2 family endonuclease [Sciscionella marina]